MKNNFHLQNQFYSSANWRQFHLSFDVLIRMAAVEMVALLANAILFWNVIGHDKTIVTVSRNGIRCGSKTFAIFLNGPFYDTIAPNTAANVWGEA